MITISQTTDNTTYIISSVDKKDQLTFVLCLGASAKASELRIESHSDGCSVHE